MCLGERGSAEPDYSQADFHFSLMKHEASVTVSDVLAANHSHERIGFWPFSSVSRVFFFKSIVVCLVSHSFGTVSCHIRSQKQAVPLKAGAVVPVLGVVSDPECQMDPPGQESETTPSKQQTRQHHRSPAQTHYLRNSRKLHLHSSTEQRADGVGHGGRGSPRWR